MTESEPSPNRHRTITSITRRSIFDLLVEVKDAWWGRLDEVEFLSRLYDLEALPSHDQRMETAYQDIGTHRISFHDWEDDWVLEDPRFNLMEGDDEVFLRFLSESVHPLVRPDRSEAESLVNLVNRELAADGWALVVNDQISGRPVFGPSRISSTGSVDARLPLDEYKLLQDRSVLEEHMRRIQAGLQVDPAGAVGASKELLESVCKVVLTAHGVEWGGGDSVMELYKKTAAALKLSAEAIPESAKGSQAAQKVLRSLVSVVQGLAELRNEVGSGHGRAFRSPAAVRHAQLAFDAAATVSRLLLETWHVRQPDRLDNTRIPSSPSQGQ